MALFIYPPLTVPGGATETTALDILAAVDGLETLVGSTNTKLDTLNGKDFATQTTLAAAKADLDSLVAKDYATSAKQDSIIGYVDGLETLVTSTNSKLDTLNAKDFATETTLAKLRKWPYATHASITPTEDATNTYYTYKTAGGATVGTITTNKTTGVVTYSPDKVV